MKDQVNSGLLIVSEFHEAKVSVLPLATELELSSPVTGRGTKKMKRMCKKAHEC